MEYLDDSSGETLVKGDPEPCPECGRPMLAWTFTATVPPCRPSDGNAMCTGPRPARKE